MAPTSETKCCPGLTELEEGHRVEFNGVDVSAAWKERYEQLLARYERLIAKQEQREREGRLKENITFRD